MALLVVFEVIPNPVCWAWRAELCCDETVVLHTGSAVYVLGHTFPCSSPNTSELCCVLQPMLSSVG